VRYELFLRRDDASSLNDDDLVIIQAQISATVLSFEPFVDKAGARLGVDLGIDLDEPAIQARKPGAIAFHVAQAMKLSVFDPQLGRVLSPRDLEALEACFAASSTIGRVGLSHAIASPKRPATTRLWLIAAGVLLLLLVASRLLSCWL